MLSASYMAFNFKTKFISADISALNLVIKYVFKHITEPALEEQLMLACLAEISLQIERKMLEPKTEYKLNLSPAQAIALKMLYQEYMQLGFTNGQLVNSLDAKMLMVCNNIHQQYQLNNETTKF